MPGFRFPLQRVLDWRRTELELAEARYKQQLAAAAALDRLRAETEAAGIRAELEVRQGGPVSGRDLAALDHFRLHVKNEEARLAVLRAEVSREAATRHGAMLEARRRARLLERLRERRLDEWETARNRELEEIAAESYLAGWNRRSAESG